MFVALWALHVIGLAASLAFVVLYLVRSTPWRRPPGEPIEIVLARAKELAWSVTVAVVYVLTTSSLIGATAIDWRVALGWRAVGAPLTVFSFAVQLYVGRRRKAGR